MLYSYLTAEEVDQLFSGEPCFSQQRYQSAFGQITIVLGDNCPPAGSWIVEDEVTAGRVVECEAVLFQESDELTRPNGR